jgi:hypothetical protein
LNHLINFEKFISTNGIFLNIHYYPSQKFLDEVEISYENFNIFENNIINVELAKVLGGYITTFTGSSVYSPLRCMLFFCSPKKGLFALCISWAIHKGAPKVIEKIYPCPRNTKEGRDGGSSWCATSNDHKPNNRSLKTKSRFNDTWAI